MASSPCLRQLSEDEGVQQNLLLGSLVRLSGFSGFCMLNLNHFGATIPSTTHPCYNNWRWSGFDTMVQLQWNLSSRSPAVRAGSKTCSAVQIELPGLKRQRFPWPISGFYVLSKGSIFHRGTRAFNHLRDLH